MADAMPPVMAAAPGVRSSFPESLLDVRTEAGVREALHHYNARVVDDRRRPARQAVPHLGPNGRRGPDGQQLARLVAERAEAASAAAPPRAFEPDPPPKRRRQCSGDDGILSAHRTGEKVPHEGSWRADTACPRAPLHRLLRDAEPVGCRERPRPRAAGFQGAGDDERRLRLDARSRGQPASRCDQALEHLRTVAAAVSVPVNADFEGGFAVDPRGREQRQAGAADGGRRAVDRGLVGRRGRPAVRLRAGRGADRAARRRSTRAVRDRADRALRGFVGRPTRHRRDDPPAACVRRGRRRLPLRPADRDPEHVSAIVAAVAPKPVNLLINAPFTTVAEAAELGCADQRGRNARANRVGRVPRGRAGDRGGGTFSAFEGLPTSTRASEPDFTRVRASAIAIHMPDRPRRVRMHPAATSDNIRPGSRDLTLATTPRPRARRLRQAERRAGLGEPTTSVIASRHR